MKSFLFKVLIGFGVVVLIAVILRAWPYTLVAAPDTVLTVVDNLGTPLSGIRVVREWRTSEKRSGESEAVTDSKGQVTFPIETESFSMLHRVTKPLLIFIPASCGPSWEIYGQSSFRIFWPSGYRLTFDGSDWTRFNEVWRNPEGIHIRDPNITAKSYRGNHIELYVYSSAPTFRYTLRCQKTE